jgi:GABA(A) receptor-associated protein
MGKFKDDNTFEKRKKSAEQIRAKYRDKIPVIVEKDPKNSSMAEMKQNKFLVPDSITIAQFLSTVRKHCSIDQSEALFLFINGNILAPNSAIMSQIYQEHRDEDGFLYFVVGKEATFG